MSEKVKDARLFLLKKKVARAHINDDIQLRLESRVKGDDLIRRLEYRVRQL